MTVISDIQIQPHMSLISLTSQNNETAVIADLFNALYKHHVNIDLISQTSPKRGHMQLCFTISDNHLFHTMNCIQEIIQISDTITIDVHSNQSKVVLIGNHLGLTPGIAAHVLTQINDANLTVSMITTSENSITLLVKSTDVTIIQALYSQMQNAQTKSL